MASKEELYISLNPDVYKINKAHLLTNQADILQILKHMHNLKVLARRKHDLKKRLHKIILSTISQANFMQDKLPTPQIPKSVQKEELQKEEIKEDLSKRDKIEKELKVINEKLRELNN